MMKLAIDWLPATIKISWPADRKMKRNVDSGRAPLGKEEDGEVVGPDHLEEQFA